jgi:hypothetical protein
MCRDEFILNCGSPMDWAEIVHEFPDEDASLAGAFSALSVSRVGKQHQDDRLVRESTKIYGQALKDMQVALWDPERMHSDQVLVASMLLGLYETLESSTLDSGSWLSHAQGAARLIQLRGPERHRNRQAHHVFLGSRVPTIFAAIAQRKATYLASEQWRSVPWEREHRTYKDRLIDVATAVPGLLEEVDSTRLGVANPLTYSTKLQLLQDMAKTQHAMNKWKEHVKDGAAAIVVPHEARDDGYPYDVDIWFNNHLFVSAHSVYWCSSLALAETATALIQDLEAYDVKDVLTQVEQVRHYFRPAEHASCIAKTINYCLQSDMGALGTCIISFPATLALRYFIGAGDSTTSSWLVKVFKDLRNPGLQASTQLGASDPVTRSQNTTPILGIKVESPSSSSDSGISIGSEQSSNGPVVIRFITEDPSQDYLDTS